MATSPYKNVSFYGQGPLNQIQRDYAPSMQMAQQLMANGSNTAPVQSPLEGIARALQGGLGGYTNYATMKAMGDRQTAANDAMIKALSGAKAKEFDRPTPDFVGPMQGSPGGLQGVIDAGLRTGNQDIMLFLQNAQMMKMQQDQAAQQAEIDRRQGIADYRTKAKIKAEFSGGDPTSNMRDYAERERLVKIHGEDSPQVRRFDDYVSSTKIVNQGGKMGVFDPSNPSVPSASLPVTPKPEQMPEFKAAVKTAEGEAAAAVKSRAEYEARGIKSKQALDALVGVDELINNSTGSWGGAAFDMIASVFGGAPEGALNVGKLKVLQANLMLSQPRMEGPQSDRDVNLYRDAAGQIGDPTVPNKIKLAAVETIRSLHRKYATPDAESGSGGNTRTSTSGASIPPPPQGFK
jgi:hypothetical protein